MADTTLVNWIAGKPDINGFYDVHKAIDKLSKGLNSLKQSEEFCLERAAVELEEAKNCARNNNKSAALRSLKKKKLYNQQAQRCRDLQLLVREKLISCESIEKQMIEVLRDGDFTTQKTTQVLIYVCFFFLILSYFYLYI